MKKTFKSISCCTMIFMLVVSFSICNVYADDWGDLNVDEQIKNGIAAGAGGAVVGGVTGAMAGGVGAVPGAVAGGLTGALGGMVTTTVSQLLK